MGDNLEDEWWKQKGNMSDSYYVFQVMWNSGGVLQAERQYERN